MPSDPKKISKAKGQSITPESDGTKNYVNLPEIIGIPPSTGSGVSATENLLRNSSLILKITPCVSKFEPGLSLFTLERAWKKYKDLLNLHKFSPNSIHNSNTAISVAVQADSFPSDTFTNEYGESFLNKITDVGSSAFGELAQITGKTTGTEGLKALGGGVKGIGGSMAEMIGSGMESTATGLEGIKGRLQQSSSPMVQGMADMADRLIAGAKIDFPMIWKNSSYTSTFSFNIKLWNPNPGDEESTNKYIIGPLAALLILGLPQTTGAKIGDSSYTWPFFCKVSCKGLFNIHAGAIANISVSKGGDSGQIGWNQRLGMVDVKIDFINLHSTLIVSNFDNNSRPTLMGYLTNLLEAETLHPIYNYKDYDTNTTEKPVTTKNVLAQPGSSSPQINDSTTPAQSRVTITDKNMATDLEENSPMSV